ncbi:MAG: ABC transporter ATP-binding protein [Bacteroidetes bacterium]|nr:ABC transporter ATP-binding protein [Bacteroidota bacterium]
MNDIVIKAEDISKKYILAHQQAERYTAIRDVIAEKVKRVLKGRANKDVIQSKEEFWALKNINFEIKQGDRVGIIGRNGAGKSTLLKVLSRITEPAGGRITLKGRVASLLEVGTGFHPELTGRENIFLNGAILGMSRIEIRKKFDEIVAFAEIEKFLDTPVKRYSSGMYVRLAFSVAAHLEPEILIVDEVLAVGDAQFQKKCLGKMEDVSRNGGRTVLFVSHNMTAMQSLCNIGMLFEKGELKYKGNMSETITRYLKQFTSGKRKVQWEPEQAPGNLNAKLLKAEVRVINRPQAIADIFETGDALEFQFVFFNEKEGLTALDVTFHLLDEMGHLIFVGSSGIHNTVVRNFERGEVKFICRIPADLIHEGSYNISRLLLVQDRGTVNLEIKDVIQFDVISKQEENWGWMGGKEGIIKPRLEWFY